MLFLSESGKRGKSRTSFVIDEEIARCIDGGVRLAQYPGHLCMVYTHSTACAHTARNKACRGHSFERLGTYHNRRHI